MLIPQNGDKPALLLAKSNTIILSADSPETQLVTLLVTVRGQRVSTSVLFSTIQDKATIVSARAPLPADAAWGPHSETVASLLREPDTANNQIMADNASLEAPQRQQESTKSPISLVFLGSLRLDGQKHIWLQQLERLDRARFAPKYLSFHREEESERANSIAGRALPWKTDDMEVFKRRLHNASVPLLRASIPRVDLSCISESSGDKFTANKRKEVGLRTVFESVDSAGGKPHLMSPPWTREFFLVIADAIKSASPDVLVFANGATLGDAIITRAARWAMGSRGLKIVMDFPNLKPAQGVDVDILATPSHYVARHPDIEALAESTGARVVVIPPGTQTASSVISTVGDGVFDALPPSEKISRDSLHDPACSSDELTDLGCRDPDCHVRRAEVVQL